MIGQIIGNITGLRCLLIKVSRWFGDNAAKWAETLRRYSGRCFSCNTGSTGSCVVSAGETDGSRRLADPVRSKYSNVLKPLVIALPAPNGLGNTLRANSR